MKDMITIPRLNAKEMKRGRVIYMNYLNDMDLMLVILELGKESLSSIEYHWDKEIHPSL